MAGDYIPTKDADFSAWLLNFSTLIAAAPATYGLVAGDAAVITAANDLWAPAYLAATDPSTRTSVTVAAKDAARVSATRTVRPYAQQISKNSAVTDANKAAVGVTIPGAVPSPIPAPTAMPQLSVESAQPLVMTLRYQSSEAGTGKAKPSGSKGVEVWRSVGVAAATDPVQTAYVATVTKCPFKQAFDAADQGKKVTFFARFVTTSGPGGVAQTGPWSAPLTLTVM